MGPVADVDRDVLGDGRPPGEVPELVPRGQPGRLRVRERPQDPVVEREDLVALGFVPPPRDQRGDPFRVLRGEVRGLGQVLGDVVQLPDVVVERRVGVQAVVVERPDGMERHRFPPVVIDGPRAEHLEVLRRVPGLGGGAVGAEQVPEADPVDRGLGDAVDLARRGDTDKLEDGRGHVDGVRELVPDRARGASEAAGPRHNARVGDAPLVDLPLPALERGVARHRPAPRIVVMGEGAADLVDAGLHLRARRGIEVVEADVVDRPLGAAFGAGPVVRDQHHEGVVPVAGLVEELEDPAELMVRIREEGREALHEQAGTHAGRGESRVSRGRSPRSSCRAKVRSRQASQPSSNAPRYRSIQSRGAWWGEWQAPVQR